MRRSYYRTALCVLVLASASVAGADDSGTEPLHKDHGRHRSRALLGLLAPAEARVQVSDVPRGVELRVLAEDPDDVVKLQEQVEEAADDIRRMAERLARWRRRRPETPLPGDLATMLAEGDATLSVTRVENGSVVQVLTENEEHARELQENIRGWVAQARERRQRMTSHFRRAAIAAELRRLVQQGVVDIHFEKTTDGMNVRFESDDPVMARKLNRMLTRYFESLTHPDTEPPRPGRGHRDRDPGRKHEE
jgi:type II secretory ATPase GspE/PulE/Tfp pilus assembly ATPase PilB-like protein